MRIVGWLRDIDLVLSNIKSLLEASEYTHQLRPAWLVPAPRQFGTCSGLILETNARGLLSGGSGSIRSAVVLHTLVPVRICQGCGCQQQLTPMVGPV